LPSSSVDRAQAQWVKSIDSSLFSLKNVFEIKECDQIILASAESMKKTGLIHEKAQPDIRQSEVHWIDEEKEGDWVLRRLMREVSDANKSHFDFHLSDFSELIQIARYKSTEGGHYDWHTDLGGSAIASRRKLTMVVQLSDPKDYAGGLLEVNVGGNIRQASLEQGSAVFFPSFMLHRVTPVIEGVRYSLACWVHGPTFQ
jgi:PKHD-type hydroxylase